MLLTHNSFSLPGLVASPNHNRDEGRQFRDGIRGFNFDVYDGSQDTQIAPGQYHVDKFLWVHHGHVNGEQNHNLRYNTRVKLITDELDKPHNKFELVVIVLENKAPRGWEHHIPKPWGDRVIENFDSSKTFDFYLNQGKNVLIFADNHPNPALGVHDMNLYLSQNDYKWFSSADPAPMGHLAGPTNPHQGRKYARVMNHFCTTFPGLGSMLSSAIVNTKDRILYNARRYIKQWYSGGKVNIITLDYYEAGGNVFHALSELKAGDYYDGCWGDGALCGIGTSCFRCCNPHKYWVRKLMTACGDEPCWGGGTVCGAGTTCRACCHGAHCPWYWFGVCKCR